MLQRTLDIFVLPDFATSPFRFSVFAAELAELRDSFPTEFETDRGEILRENKRKKFRFPLAACVHALCVECAAILCVRVRALSLRIGNAPDAELV